MLVPPITMYDYQIIPLSFMLSQQVHAVPCIRNSPTHIFMELLGIKLKKDVYVSLKLV